MRSEPDGKLVDQRDCSAKAAFCSATRMNRQSERRIEGLIHPVHQVLRVFGWEILSTTHLS